VIVTAAASFETDDLDAELHALALARLRLANRASIMGAEVTEPVMVVTPVGRGISLLGLTAIGHT
jgi:hypothetical protein